MSAPDVLAVMATDAIAAEEWRMSQAGDKYAAAAMKTSHEARAAVAELIEAAGDYLARQADAGLHVSSNRLQNALARISGGGQ